MAIANDALFEVPPNVLFLTPTRLTITTADRPFSRYHWRHVGLFVVLTCELCCSFRCVESLVALYVLSRRASCRVDRHDEWNVNVGLNVLSNRDSKRQSFPNAHANPRCLETSRTPSGLSKLRLRVGVHALACFLAVSGNQSPRSSLKAELQPSFLAVTKHSSRISVAHVLDVPRDHETPGVSSAELFRSSGPFGLLVIPCNCR